MDMNNTLEAIKDILIYWVKEIIEKTFYLVIIIIFALILFYVRNPYGRYLDSWYY